MKKKDIIKLYQDWRKENKNQKPNRVIVRMKWDDEEDNPLVDTIGIVPLKDIGETENIKGDEWILYYVSSLDGLFALMKPNNGSEFTVLEVLEFWKQK